MQLFLPANSLAEIFIGSEGTGEMNPGAQALPTAAPGVTKQLRAHALLPAHRTRPWPPSSPSHHGKAKPSQGACSALRRGTRVQERLRAGLPWRSGAKPGYCFYASKAETFLKEPDAAARQLSSSGVTPCKEAHPPQPRIPAALAPHEHPREPRTSPVPAAAIPTARDAQPQGGDRFLIAQLIPPLAPR